MRKMLRIAKGSFLALGIFLFLILILAVLLRSTSVPQQFALPFGMASCAAATFFFGGIVGSTFEKRGLLLGFVSAAAFVILLFFLAAAAVSADPVSLSRNPWLVIPVIFGGAGGIAGVNRKK